MRFVIALWMIARTASSALIKPSFSVPHIWAFRRWRCCQIRRETWKQFGTKLFVGWPPCGGRWLQTFWCEFETSAIGLPKLVELQLVFE